METQSIDTRPKNKCFRCGNEHPTALFVTWPNGKCLLCPDQPKGKPVKKMQLWDVQISRGKNLKETLFYGLQRGVAEMKKKVLIMSGTMRRNIHLVRAGTEPLPPKRIV
jgi:hypothetical protein